MQTRRTEQSLLIILDEYNRVTTEDAYDLEAPQRMGAFSTAFLRKIAARIKEVSTSKRLRGVARR